MSWLNDVSDLKTKEEKQAEAKAQKLSSITQAVQQLLDNKAKELHYDSILSLATYATSTHPKFKGEGQAAIKWRDAVWAKCYEILDDVESGQRSDEVTFEDIVAELPVFTISD